MEPHGLGPLQLAFEQLKKKLAAEGLFDAGAQAAAARACPGASASSPRSMAPRCATSSACCAAAIPTRTSSSRRRACRARTPPAKSCAPSGRSRRIEGVDVVIVGRGGGSLEDLWAFNEEKVARAIAACPVPVISAVGHETDFTIADFVADLRAPTPSAAAELVVRRKDEFYGHIDRLANGSMASMRARVRRLESRVNALAARPGFAGYRGRVAMRGRHVAELTAALRHAIISTLARRARRHEQLRRALEPFDPRHRLAAVRARLRVTRGQLGQGV